MCAVFLSSLSLIIIDFVCLSEDLPRLRKKFCHYRVAVIKDIVIIYVLYYLILCVYNLINAPAR